MSQLLYTFVITGRVQGVFFRKTVVHLAHLAGMQCGATNSANPSEVYVTFQGEFEQIDHLLKDITQGKAINKCGCIPRSYHAHTSTIAINHHQMTTEKLLRSPLPNGII